MQTVTLKTFNNYIEAQMLKAKLESEGIECYLFDENIISLIPVYDVTAGGIKLNVNQDDLDQARAILTEIDNTPLTDDDEELVAYPKCNSSNVFIGYLPRRKSNWLIIAFSLIIGALFTYNKNTVYKCKGCGYEFYKKKE